jgi:hypothetical protein
MRGDKMRMLVLLLPVAVLLVLLGFLMAQVGENKGNATRTLQAKLNLVTRALMGKQLQPKTKRV